VVKFSCLRSSRRRTAESLATIVRAWLGLVRIREGNRIQRIEQEVGIDLAGERRQARLHQQPFLLLELLLVARVVPDLQWNGHREKRGGVEGQDGQGRRMGPAGRVRRQVENLFGLEEIAHGLAQELATRMAAKKSR